MTPDWRPIQALNGTVVSLLISSGKPLGTFLCSWLLSQRGTVSLHSRASLSLLHWYRPCKLQPTAPTFLPFPPPSAPHCHETDPETAPSHSVCWEEGHSVAETFLSRAALTSVFVTIFTPALFASHLSPGSSTLSPCPAPPSAPSGLTYHPFSSARSSTALKGPIKTSSSMAPYSLKALNLLQPNLFFRLHPFVS